VNGGGCRLPAGLLSEGLATTRLLFGTETIEYRTPSATRVGAMLGIKEYPTPSVIGMYKPAAVGTLSTDTDAVLRLPVARRGSGTAATTVYRMANAGDFACRRRCSEEVRDRQQIIVMDHRALPSLHRLRPGEVPGVGLR